MRIVRNLLIGKRSISFCLYQDLNPEHEQFPRRFLMTGVETAGPLLCTEVKFDMLTFHSIRCHSLMHYIHMSSKSDVLIDVVFT
jgi:hypothetical protein